MDRDIVPEGSTKEAALRLPYSASQLDKRKKKAKWFVKVSAASFILGWMLLSLNRFQRGPSFFVGFLFMSFLLPPILMTAAGIIYLPRKNILSRFLLIGLIIILIPLFLIIIRMILVIVLPYVYTPPALTPENLIVYNRCIQFAKNHDGDKTLTIARGARVFIKGDFYILSSGNAFERNRARKVFSEQEIIEMERLCHQLFAVRCVLFKRDNDMLLFYKWYNSIFAVDPLELTYVIPIGPGVLYSLNGKNPNEIDSGVLNTKKPFINISGNWYISGHLMLSGPRSDAPGMIPKSLFDHSLHIDRIDSNELYKFD